MKSICIRILILTFLLGSACATTLPTQPPDPYPATEITLPPANTPSAVPRIQLHNPDELMFTIPNPEPFSGREGEARPDWLGWGAGTFTVAPDGSFWIADTAVFPNRLLHYSPQGERLQTISLENLVVYAFDLAVTEYSLWLLDISAQPPKIVQLNMDGRLQSNVNLSRGSGTADGEFVSNEAFDLSIGEKGELYLLGLSGYHEVVDESGKITGQPLNSLEYFGHTYQAGVYKEATRNIPIFVDGTLLDLGADFFVEMPFLGFQPDGSFALAGLVEDTRHQIDRQVRYYDSTGKLLGTARQQPQTFYKDWNHHLAVGPDGYVYQLLSNPDHTVQILRLGFFEALPPLPSSQLALPPTPLTALEPTDSTPTDEEQAKNALLAFFSGLGSGDYDQAAAYFGGETNEYAREPLPDETPGEYWRYICGTVLWCLPVADITATEKVSAEEYIFTIVFMQPDGTRFETGACCGGDPAAFPPVWQFRYQVRKIDGKWKVMRAPVFTP